MKASMQGSEVKAVLMYLARCTGLTFPANRMRDFELGIRKVMASYSITNAGRFIQHISANRAAFDAMVAEITVGETYFFREPAQFEAIRQIVLPSLLRDRGPDAPVRVWSAGCATGEEAYSIAIMAEEEGLWDRVQVLGTDISVAALKKAKKGEYGAWSFRDDQREPDERYFRRNNRRFQLVERIRSRVRFDVLNLASIGYPSSANGTAGVDLILCRNVLIYLDEKSVKQVAERLLGSLVEGGWLITGPSDPPLWEYVDFTTVITQAGVFYRRKIQPAPAAMQAPQREPLRSPLAAARQPRPAAAVPNPADKPPHTSPGAGDRRGGAASKSREGTDAAASRIRAMANTGALDAAEESAAEAVARDPLSAELHFVHSVLLIALERQNEALASLRKVMYLDPTLAAAHLALGSLLQRRGELAAARRAFATAHALCVALPTAEPVPLTDGDTAGRLAESAEAQIRVLDDRIRAES